MFEIKPKTRKEIYMAYLAGDMSLELPEPMTRDEVTLYNLCQSHAYGTAEAYLLPETELTFEMNEDLGVPMAMISLAYEMEVGNTYTVSFDGVEYTCQAIERGAGSSALGNLGAFGGDDTGEPFVIFEEGVMFVIPLNGANSAVMSIKGVVDVPIEDKYAPEPPLLDLFAMGMSEIDKNVQTPLQFNYGREDIVKLAAKKGLIKIRASISVEVMEELSSNINGWMDLRNGLAEFVAPVFRVGNDYLVQAFYNDCMLVLRFMPGGVVSARAVKLAIYDNQGTIYPQT